MSPYVVTNDISFHFPVGDEFASVLKYPGFSLPYGAIRRSQQETTVLRKGYCCALHFDGYIFIVCIRRYQVIIFKTACIFVELKIDSVIKVFISDGSIAFHILNSLCAAGKVIIATAGE